MMNVWHDFFYYPLFNFLIFLYSGPAFGSLGLAIIELTVILRVALLPFSVLEERSRYLYEKLAIHIAEIEVDFKSDSVLRKKKVRELLRQHNVNYWYKFFVMAMQGLVLVLIYQVFMGGLRLQPGEMLYSWVSVPVEVNTWFLGFDLATRSLEWAVAVGLLLFTQIFMSSRKNEHVTKADVAYMIFFPLFVFFVLWYLPMVKALFIMTSMLFGIVIKSVRRTFFRVEATKR